MTSDMDRHTILANAFVEPEEVHKARIASARNATDSEELVVFLKMLGIYPGQENPLIVRGCVQRSVI